MTTRDCKSQFTQPISNQLIGHVACLKLIIILQDVANYSLLAANTAPVNAPEVIEFHGSSFCLICTRAQSNVENKPPQTAKLPANCKKMQMISCG